MTVPATQPSTSPSPAERLSERPPRRLRVLPVLRGRYDAAATTEDNRRHWANADGLSAVMALTPEVRQVLRNRARYEVANNSYAKGIVLTLANDVVGTGPRLQMLSGDEAANDVIEQEFTDWCRATGVAAKLRTMRFAVAQDGEAFGLLVTNPKVDHAVKLDTKLVETDQVATPVTRLDGQYTEGIVFDDWGNPIQYHVLKNHPGGPFTSFAADYERIDAADMLHVFRVERPGQTRGVPDIVPALPLFAQLRRYTLAVIAAAETAADFAGILYTDAPPDGETADLEPLDAIELEARALMTMPGGWKMQQMQAEQPATTYAEFKAEVLNEIARCLNMPFNIAAGNSSKYNYASGRLDDQVYRKALRIDRDLLEVLVLDRLLAKWFEEARRIPGLLPAGVEAPRRFDYAWVWDGSEHVDPAKEAQAQAIRLESHTTTLAAEYAKQGKDWEKELRQRAKEVALERELGLSQAPTPGTPGTPDQGEPVTENEEDDAEAN